MGVGTGVMELSISMIEARRRQQAAAAQDSVGQPRSAQADSAPAKLPSVRGFPHGALRMTSDCTYTRT